MEVLEEKVDNLNSKIKINLKPEDYQPRVETVLKDHKRKAQMPGFRKGKVPFGVVKKMYGPSVLADEVNKILVDELYKFIEEQKLNLLGNPLPSESQDDSVDWENPKEMTFTYDVGLLPEIKVDLKKSKFTYYDIEISEEEVKKNVDNLATRYGTMEETDLAGEKSLVFGEFKELDEEGNVKEGGINHSASVAVDMIVDKDLQKEFIGAKKGAEFTLKADQVTANSADAAAMLGITKEQAEGLQSKFSFKAEKVQSMKPAEINEEFFKKLYPQEEVTTLEQLNEKFKEEIGKHYAAEADKMFKNDVALKLIADLKISLPDEFLKRWLVASNNNNKDQKEPLTKEQVEADYDKYSDGLKWQLIENEIIKTNGLKVEEEELREEIKKVVIQQYAYYGIPEPDEENMKGLVDSFLGNQEQVRGISDKLYDTKILDLFKSSFTLTKKTVSADEFYKIASEPAEKKSGLFSFLKK